MRLLDQIAQAATPLLIRNSDQSLTRLTSACDFSKQLTACPLRYVLADELTSLCTALAYSEGDQLSSCLDLIHIPAQQLWVEWADKPRREELARAFPREHERAADPVLWAGAFIQSNAQGRRGTMRTFWSTAERPADPLVAALVTHFDLDECLPVGEGIDALFEGKLAAVHAPEGNGVQETFSGIRYGFDEAWLEYYAQKRLSGQEKVAILQQSLSSVAHDLPVLLALFLLQITQSGVGVRPTSLKQLNAKRHRRGKAPLLDHVELTAPVLQKSFIPHGSEPAAQRHSPKYHHVRGHIVRRGAAVYYRAPHYRGHVRLGRVASRTVGLRSTQ